ncbi:MAG: acetyltransferase [Candidatus Peregrinibacteria bacterium GW2011_GWE2_39_6]|nr:MAG: acetyltransferase [Candidatus Peregrinibacteria bacterium GW2011_GWF2_39_17]KKR26074.1 MAG: acetyltransferase [Candidatus Peregrinibacteria bacterium GW2011_GWE2_39_6]HCW32120.1 hypothetical protein [Candidatus Peregrinibacteria bacterium]
MLIQKMTFPDLDKVATLYQDANSFAKKKDIFEWTKEGLMKFPNFNLVYKKNEKIIGAISAILLSKGKVEINDIAIQKKYRGQTIGSKLLKRLIKEFKKEGIKKITLWVHWSNARAIPFYYKLKFQIKKCTKTSNIDNVPNGEDIICLEQIIQP